MSLLTSMALRARFGCFRQIKTIHMRPSTMIHTGLTQIFSHEAPPFCYRSWATLLGYPRVRAQVSDAAESRPSG